MTFGGVQVPIHLHTNWDSFYMEMLMLGGLAAYLLNFLAGKNKNSKLAQSWLAAHRQLLEDNFAVIGLYLVLPSHTEYKHSQNYNNNLIC